jgi:SNF2 family DNA or RNA helicase
VPHVELQDNRIVLTAEWREREAVKELPGHKYDAEDRTWYLPLSWSSCVQARGVFGETLTIGEGLNTWAADDVQNRIAPCLALRDAEDADIIGPNAAKLEKRQRAGVAFMSRARRALCADGMGSGKTVQAISAVEELAALGENVFPVVVVAPNSMCHRWKQEIETWSPGRTVEVIAGGAAKRRRIIETEPDWLIINWEALRSHTRVSGYGYIRLTDRDKQGKELNAIRPKTVIADEAHRAKNPKSQQTRAWWYLSHHATFSFAFTGTPVANTPEDLWSIMHGISPEEWPSKTQWVDRYGLIQWNPFGGMSIVGIKAETREEMFRILDPRFIRRPTQVVIPNIAKKLPPQIREIDLVAKQRKAYDQMRKEMLAELESGVLMATSPLTKLTRLSQLAAAYGVVDENGDLRLAEPSATLDAFDDILEELGDEPTIAFAESRQLIELAGARLTRNRIDHALITGSIEPHQRQLSVDRFQRGEIRVLLLTLGAGGEGLTLTATRFPVFLQESFSLVRNLQAVDRAWRRGQDRDVQPIVIRPRDTIAERVGQVRIEKEARLEEVVRDEQTLRRLLS